MTRAKDLPPEQLGRFWAVMLGGTVVGVSLEVPALVLGVRAATYARRRHGAGFREVVGSGPVTRALVLVGAALVWRRVTSALMVRALRQLVERVERDERDGSIKDPADRPS
ncbi:hypothetical protein [Microlunatus sagamiharensis]|uniref:hypothetical protein n=1 Tax=Microlunatus sagamiharensis TaxID=546874 RepID=UPI0012FE25FA|nr:hypothetical protein [Microlunatus sagamiharensis]